MRRKAYWDTMEEVWNRIDALMNKGDITIAALNIHDLKNDLAILRPYIKDDTDLAVEYNEALGLLNSMECWVCLLYTSPSPRDRQKSRMPSSA